MWAVPVSAASFGMSASTSTVGPNGTFTVSIGGDCIGRVDLSVSNGTLSTNSVWVEENYQTVSVTAGGSGSVTITATPAPGFSDSLANEFFPGGRSVVVMIEAPAIPPSNPGGVVNPSVPNRPSGSVSPSVDQKSDNNLLSSLTIGTGNLSPAFDASVLEYSVNLSADVTSILVQAVCADEKAQISGTGEIKLSPGDNVIPVTVTSESGLLKTYTIRAYVEEKPNVYLNYRNQKIGVVRDLRDVLVPEGFSRKDIMINNISSAVFDNGHFSIIYGIDDDLNKGFYLFDTVKQECISKVEVMTLDGHTLYFVDLDEKKDGFRLDTTTILDRKVSGYSFEDGFENYFLLSVLNENGERVEYLYEKSEGTLQLYAQFVSLEQYQELTYQLKFRNSIIILMSIGLVFSIGGLFILFWKFRKDRSHEEVS